MSDNNETSLDALFNDQPASSEHEEVSEESHIEESHDEPEDKGVTASPPEAKQNDPVAAFKAKALDESRKRQESERKFRELEAKYQAQQKPPEPEPAPTQQHFATQEEYLDAVAERKAQQVFDAALKKLGNEQDEAAIRQQETSDKEEMLSPGKAKYANFDDVVRNQNVPITDTMVYSMLAVNDGHEVAYYLGNHPDEAYRIAQLPASSQAREIRNLAKQVASPPPPPEVVNLPKTLTQTRSAAGQFTQKAWTGPTPLNDIFKKPY